MVDNFREFAVGGGRRKQDIPTGARASWGATNCMKIDACCGACVDGAGVHVFKDEPDLIGVRDTAT
jgi:hypothetical protein